MKKILLLLFFTTKCILVFAQNDSVIVLDNKNKALNIGKQVYLFEDKEAKLSFEDIQKPEYQKQFKKSEQEIPNFNTTRSKIWVKLTVANQTDERVYLEVAQGMAWYIDFYKPDITEKLVLTTQTGMMRPFENREVDNNFFLFELAKTPKSQTYYFSIQSEFPLNIPLMLASKETLIIKITNYNLFFGGFTGLMLIMFFYNLFLFFSFRDRLYLYYCFYLSANFLIVAFVSGNYAYQLNPISYISSYFITLGLFSSLSTAAFIIHLLQVPKKRIFYKALLSWVVLNLIFTLFNLITGHYIQIIDFVQGIMLVVFVYILVDATYNYLKGNRQARFVVFGFSFHLIGVVIYLVQNFGLIPTNFFTANAPVFGASIEVLLFSLALADRINTMRREKEEALLAKQNTQIELLQKSRENEKLIKNQNKILAEKVEEKTKDIELKNQKLLASEEELRQNMEELEASQELLREQKQLIEDAFGELHQQNTKVNDSIRYAQRIQNAILPHQNTLANAFTEHFVIFKPKDVVSGDFYWYLEIENKKFLAIVDCTGHGVPGAFMSMIGNTLLYEIINAKRIFEPHLILEQLHLGILTTLNSKDAKIQDGMDIALCCIESKENGNIKVQFSGAKRPLYHFSKQKLTEIQADRKSIGSLSTQVSYMTNEIILQAGDTLYMTTDGWIDAINPERRRFGSQQFREMLIKGANLPLKAQGEVFTTILEDYGQDVEQRDDVLLVGVKV